MSGNGKEKKMKQIVLVAETGSDINPVLAAEYNIKIVPMHVSFDHETMEDGAFPVEKIVDYYEETGRLPKTSGSTPGDFETAFDRIHAEYPDAQLLYLAYSAVTTCSMQSVLDLMAQTMAAKLRTVFGNRVLGPDKPPVARVQTLFIRKIVLKIETNAPMARARELLVQVQKEMVAEDRFKSLIVYYDVDPM